MTGIEEVLKPTTMGSRYDPERMERVPVRDLDDLERELDDIDMVKAQTVKVRLRRLYMFMCAMTGFAFVFGACAALIHNKHLEKQAQSTNASGTMGEDLQAPSDLAEICSRDSIFSSAGLGLCQDACEVASCCHQTEGNCYSEFQELCDAFSACSILNQTPIPPSPPPDLATLCSRFNSDGLDDCEKLCNEASCCWATKLSESCLPKGMDVCKSYDHCKIVNGGIASDTFDPSAIVDDLSENQPGGGSDSGPNNDTLAEGAEDDFNVGEIVKQACAPSAVDSDSESCKRVCGGAMCCFDDGDDEHCGESFCADYSACVILTRPETEFPTAEKEISETVTVNLVDNLCLGDTMDRDACQEICDKAPDCCFKNDESNCATEDFCRDHMSCAVLHGSEADMVSNFCSEDNLTSKETLERCAQICGTRACCFDAPERSCISERLDWCNEFADCRPVMEVMFEEKLFDIP